MKNLMSVNSKLSPAQLSITFFIVTTFLFLLVPALIVAPKIENTVSSFSDNYDIAVTEAYAKRLQQYIYARELALHDIAANSFITNSILMGDGNSPGLRDLLANSSLLGKDPYFTVLDAFGTLLYSELNEENYEWVMPILDTNAKNVLRILPENSTPQLEIAVPIIYGKRAEGVLVARISAEPILVFSTQLDRERNYTISYEKNGHLISSDSQHLHQPKSQRLRLDQYDIDFTYTVDRQTIRNNIRKIYQHLVISTVIGSLLLFLVLFLIGRKFIFRPLQELASTQKAVASAVEGMSRIDASGHYITLNSSYAGAAGYTPEELHGKHWTVTVFHEDIPTLNDAYQTMLKDDKVTVEARGLRKDGTVFYKQVTMVCEYNRSGTFIGHHCFLKDITSRKVSEEKLRTQQQELQLIFDNVPVKIWYKDDKNRILRLNKKAAETMGGVVADFEGQDTYDLFPEMAKKYHEDDLKVINSNEALLGIQEEYTPLNGKRGWVSTDKIPYVDNKSNSRFIFVCSQDISDLKNAEIKQRKMIETISENNKELEQFSYIASHDLKSPLRGIEQLSQWVIDDCKDLISDESKEHLSLMTNRVQRMSSLLDDLLEYSRVGRMDLSKDKVNLQQVFSEMVDLYVQPFGFTCELDISDTDIFIARKPLEIVIRNLLDNAVKHHDKESGKITIRYRRSDDAHIINVEDDGPGIDPVFHDKVFEVFRTLKSRDKIEGSGIGLSIIRKLLHRYSGSITIETNFKAGTSFKIIWPFNQDDVIKY